MSAEPNAHDLTSYLRRWRDGDEAARDVLLPHVYERLRAMAGARLRGERPDHTLDTVALVHEAYLRVAEGREVDWQDRGHFFAVAATAMRRVLLDHARERRSEKRGGGRVRVELDPERLGDAGVVAETDPDALIALDQALARLEQLYPRQAKAVELRYYAGLTLEEIGETLGISGPTALRDLRFAQTWLTAALREE